jgi:hypothetical protein
VRITRDLGAYAVSTYTVDGVDDHVAGSRVGVPQGGLSGVRPRSLGLS